MRKNTTLTSQGLSCHGWLSAPDGLAQGQEAPAIVMAHGFSAVKEMGLPDKAMRPKALQEKRV